MLRFALISRQLPCITNNGLALESGVNGMVENKFEQPAGLKYGPGSTASGSDHRVIPEDEGGTRDDRNR